MSKLITPFVLLVLTYFATFEGSEGAQNVLTFFIWFMATVMPAGLSEKNVKAAAKLPATPKVVLLVSVFTQAAMLVSLVWRGHFFTGAACLFLIVVLAATRAAVGKERNRDH